MNLLFLLAGLAGSTVHLQESNGDRQVADLPGCNAIYRRSALAEVMPVDERLLTAEDVWMNWCLRERGHELRLVRDAVLWHHRRSSPRTFFRQVYRFAIGRLQVGRRERSLLTVPHVLTGFGLPLAAAAVAVALWAGHPGALSAATLGLGTAVFLFGLARARTVKAAAWLPVVVALFVGGWSAGFLKELFAPLRVADGK